MLHKKTSKSPLRNSQYPILCNQTQFISKHRIRQPESIRRRHQSGSKWKWFANKKTVPETLLRLIPQICHGAKLTVPIPEVSESKQKNMAMRTAYSFLPKLWKDVKAFLWTVGYMMWNKWENPCYGRRGQKKMMPKSLHDALR